MGTESIEFWYEFASPYSWIAAERIERLAAEAGVDFRWRPFLIGPILRQRPHNPSPTQDASPAQKIYRRRDVERLCAREGLALHWPTAYPRNGLLAARVAQTLGDAARRAFSLAVFRANFVRDGEISNMAVIAGLLEEMGRDVAADLARAQAPENKAALAAAVDEAIGKGIFGAPRFVIGTELFWGNDRLEQAVDWARAPWL